MIGVGVSVGISSVANNHAAVLGVNVEDQILAKAPYVWLDPSDADTVTDSSGITAITNKGSLDKDLGFSGSVKMTYANGRGICNGSQSGYSIGAAGDFNFLHDGTGATVFYIFQFDSAMSGVDYALATGGSNPSFEYRFQPAYHQVVIRAASTFNAQGAARTLTQDMDVIGSVRLGTGSGKDIEIFEDAANVYNTDDGGFAYNTSGDHASACSVNSGVIGEFIGLLIFDYKMTQSEFNAMHKLLRQYYSLNRTAKVMALTGNSNTYGLGSAGSLPSPYDGKIAGAYIYGYESSNSANELGMNQLAYAQTHYDTPSTTIGYDLSLANTWRTNNPDDKLWLLKYGASGSTLQDWNSDTEHDTFAAMHEAFEAYMESIGFSTLEYVASIVGHGENDAGNATRAASFGDDLITQVAWLRTLLGTSTPTFIIKSSMEGLDFPNVAFTAAAYQDDVRANTETAALSISNSVVVQPPVLLYNETTPSGIHFTQAAQISLGLQLAGEVEIF